MRRVSNLTLTVNGKCYNNGSSYKILVRNTLRTLINFKLLGLFLISNIHSQSSMDWSSVLDYHVHIFSPQLMCNLTAQGHDMKTSGFQIIRMDEEYSNITSVQNENMKCKMVLISAGYAYKPLNDGISEEEFVRQENDLLSDFHDLPLRI